MLFNKLVKFVDGVRSFAFGESGHLKIVTVCYVPLGAVEVLIFFRIGFVSSAAVVIAFAVDKNRIYLLILFVGPAQL